MKKKKRKKVRKKEKYMRKVLCGVQIIVKEKEKERQKANRDNSSVQTIMPESRRCRRRQQRCRPLAIAEISR